MRTLRAMSQMSELSARRARPETLARLLVCIEMRAAQPCLAQRALRGQQGAAHLVAAGHLDPRGQKALQRVDDDEGGRGLPHVL